MKFLTGVVSIGNKWNRDYSVMMSPQFYPLPHLLTAHTVRLDLRQAFECNDAEHVEAPRFVSMLDND